MCLHTTNTPCQPTFKASEVIRCLICQGSSTLAYKYKLTQVVFRYTRHQQEPNWNKIHRLLLGALESCIHRGEGWHIYIFTAISQVEKHDNQSKNCGWGQKWHHHLFLHHNQKDYSKVPQEWQAWMLWPELCRSWRQLTNMAGIKIWLQISTQMDKPRLNAD